MIIELISKDVGSGPVWNIIETCRHYDLISTVIEAVESGSYVSIAEWKKLICNVVSENDLKRSKSTCRLYKSLQILNHNVLEHRLFSWWQLAYLHPRMTRACRLILKLLMNVYQLGKNGCELCTLEKANSVEHIVFECEINHDIRTNLWEVVLETCPHQMILEMNAMSTYQRIEFILNGFFCPYVSEWTPLYISLCNYIYCVYNQYYKQYKQIGT